METCHLSQYDDEILQDQYRALTATTLLIIAEGEGEVAGIRPHHLYQAVKNMAGKRLLVWWWAVFEMVKVSL